VSRGLLPDRLTLITFVIAIAGFAGTAFATTPPELGVQVAAPASSHR